MSKLNLNTLLKLHDFEIPKKRSVKLVNHRPIKDIGIDLLAEYRHQHKKDRFEAYQCEQGKDHFKGCEFIISFLADGPSRAVFMGIYKIDNCQKLEKPPQKFKDAFPDKIDRWKPGLFWYDMTCIDRMEDLIPRLVVDWGDGAISWHQWLHQDKPKEIIEIMPKDYAPEFPGFDELRLSYQELQNMVNNPDAYGDWHRVLESVGGVYLIMDTVQGDQYVGAASGNDGILGRWRMYAKNGHGGNKKLKRIKNHGSLQFSILYTCSKSKSEKEARCYEKIFKDKLGSRAHGLNLN